MRYADDALVMCRSREQAEAALKRLRGLLAELGLEPKEAKTRIVHLKVGGEGFTFLGFHHQMVRSPARSGKRQVTFLAHWPAHKAMQHARNRLRELTDRSRLRVPVEWVVEEMNSFLEGWAAYFRYGNSARRFSQLQWYAGMRLGLFVAKRHRQGRGFGRWVAGTGNGAPGHGHAAKRPAGETLGQSGCGTSRRTTPPRQPPTLPLIARGPGNGPPPGAAAASPAAPRRDYSAGP
jgi:Group II intron, maturase-specific domain/Reverse transcriptase (RNA-dependent DNA polymerase)